MSSRTAIFESSIAYFLSPVGKLLEDDTITEVMVNGYDRVYIERRGKIEPTDCRFESHDALVSAINNIAQYVGRTISESKPILDARLPNGFRVHAIIPPTARTGAYLTIRKFTREVMTLDDMIDLGTLSESGREFLELCVKIRKNLVISGGTGTGKTCLLGALSRAIPEEERIVVIEDTSELRLIQKHCLYLEVQKSSEKGKGELSIRQLFITSLRMRPDRIIVGEVRSGEALDMVQSMLSGHAGSLTTVHANSARDALVRLETLSLMSDVELPVYVARAQVASAINLVVQITRFVEDGSRKVTRITEILGLDDENRYKLQDLYASHLRGKTPDGRLVAELEPTGIQPTFAREVFEHGLEEEVQYSEKLWTRP
ncbi:MAG: CpaF family protein [Planctomycetia bacterium]|nr:CpaF family protein [Planctomycetia bacterium]